MAVTFLFQPHGFLFFKNNKSFNSKIIGLFYQNLPGGLELYHMIVARGRRDVQWKILNDVFPEGPYTLCRADGSFRHRTTFLTYIEKAITVDSFSSHFSRIISSK
jgi:hypothetical protein